MHTAAYSCQPPCLAMAGGGSMTSSNGASIRICRRWGSARAPGSSDSDGGRGAVRDRLVPSAVTVVWTSRHGIQPYLKNSFLT